MNALDELFAQSMMVDTFGALSELISVLAGRAAKLCWNKTHQVHEVQARFC
jgi:hypothetical protein